MAAPLNLAPLGWTALALILTAVASMGLARWRLRGEKSIWYDLAALKLVGVYLVSGLAACACIYLALIIRVVEWLAGLAG
jgi:hypothetical protein